MKINEMLRAMIIILTSIVLSACSSNHIKKDTEIPENVKIGWVENLQVLASKKMNCPIDSLTYSHIKDNLHRISGCEKQEEYYLNCSKRCHWKYRNIMEEITDKTNTVEVITHEPDRKTCKYLGDISAKSSAKDIADATDLAKISLKNKAALMGANIVKLDITTTGADVESVWNVKPQASLNGRSFLCKYN